MINTSAFKSLERYQRLEDAMLKVKDPLHIYHWMHELLVQAVLREVGYMRHNKEEWVDRLRLRDE